MGMNQQFGCAALAFAKLIESNLKKWNHSKWWMSLSGTQPNRCFHFSAACCCREISPQKSDGFFCRQKKVWAKGARLGMQELLHCFFFFCFFLKSHLSVIWHSLLWLWSQISLQTDRVTELPRHGPGGTPQLQHNCGAASNVFLVLYFHTRSCCSAGFIILMTLKLRLASTPARCNLSLSFKRPWDRL